MSGRMQGRVAFITGGGAGIGRATALALAREGAKVVIAEVKEETGRAANGLLAKGGFESLFVRTDVTDEESLRGAVKQAIQRFGKLDTLFNGAGGSLPA